MRKLRTLLTVTAFVSAILGAVAVYLALTVPNDLKADSMLKGARRSLEAGRRDEARTELSRIVQSYPRTDAAAAATVALITIGEQQRRELEAEVTRLRNDEAQRARTLTELQQTVDAVKNAPPRQIIVQVPAPKPAAKKKTAAHRPSPR